MLSVCQQSAKGWGYDTQKSPPQPLRGISQSEGGAPKEAEVQAEEMVKQQAAPPLPGASQPSFLQRARSDLIIGYI